MGILAAVVFVGLLLSPIAAAAGEQVHPLAVVAGIGIWTYLAGVGVAGFAGDGGGKTVERAGEPIKRGGFGATAGRALRNSRTPR
jgi:hypothetical protein